MGAANATRTGAQLLVDALRLLMEIPLKSLSWNFRGTAEPKLDVPE